MCSPAQLHSSFMLHIM